MKQYYFNLRPIMGSIMIGLMLFITYVIADRPPKRFEKLYYTTDQFIKEAGFPCEVHFITTSDGYILRMFRIPPPKNGTGAPILLAHGLTAASDYWVLQGPNKDLAFILNQAGYDVWLGDFRGNFYSRNHTILSPEKLTFWKFSLYELGAYDIPAMIDHMIHITGHKKVGYIGHSMGSTIYFICMSTWPEYNEKVFLFIGMSPTVLSDLKNSKKGQRTLLKAAALAMQPFIEQNILELMPRKRAPSAGIILETICSEKSAFIKLCVLLGTWWAGRDHNSLSKDGFSLVYTHFPAGTGLYCMINFVQNLKSSKFSRLDYGEEKNMKIYGSKNPPEYNLSLVTSPVAFYYSHNDYISVYKDVKLTISKLPNVVYESVSNIYTHADYVFSNSAWKDLFPDILDLIYSILNKTQKMS